MHDEIDLSLFYKILIYVEDKGQLNLSDINRFGQLRPTLGALGRLEGLHYIERRKNGERQYFVLTDKGDQELASILEALKTPPEWDGAWHMILFDIPESRRTVRQTFRLKLFDSGARMLHAGVWIAPYRTSVERFQTALAQNGTPETIHVFEAKPFGLTTIDVARLWNLPAVRSAYEHLFHDFDTLMKRLAREPEPSYTAKCNIMRLALVVKQDPRLPQSMMPNDWVGQKVPLWYEKIRSFC